MPDLLTNVIGGLITAAVLALVGFLFAKWRSGGTRGWDVPENPALFRQTRILIIDDDDEAELAHIEQLRRRGFQVDRWSHVLASQATDIDLKFDLVLLDNRGVSDGYGSDSGVDAVEMIRRDNPWVPIFVFTSYPEDVLPSRKRSLTQLGVSVLSKMTRFVDFEEAIVTAISSARSRQYFVQLLDDRNVPNPGGVLDNFVEKGQRVSMHDGCDPYTRTQIERVLQVANEVYSGRRWRGARSIRSRRSQGEAR